MLNLRLMNFNFWNVHITEKLFDQRLLICQLLSIAAGSCLLKCSLWYLCKGLPALWALLACRADKSMYNLIAEYAVLLLYLTGASRSEQDWKYFTSQLLAIADSCLTAFCASSALYNLVWHSRYRQSPCNRSKDLGCVFLVQCKFRWQQVSKNGRCFACKHLLFAGRISL